MTSRRVRSIDPIRVVLVVIGGLALCWLSIAVTMSNVATGASPLLALRVWPWSSSAASALAEQDIVTATARSQEEARYYASDALARSPVDARAARVLGLFDALRARNRAAQFAFYYAQRLSRRDLPTQMWLIEQSVDQNDIPSALSHYHIAMRTSQTSRAILIPVLADAAENPAVAKPLAQLLRQRPNWWLDFYDSAVPKISSPISLALIVSALHFNPADPLEGARLRQGMQRLVALDAVDAAYHIYRKAFVAQNQAAVLIRNGGFESGVGLPPFDWQFSDSPDHQGIIEPRDGSHGSAALSIAGTSSGEVARELLMLPPGQYKLSFLIGAVRGDATQHPDAMIVCLRGAEILAFRFPATPTPQVITKTLGIPDKACRTQWLIISSNGSSEVSDPPWIDDITIRAVGRSVGRS
jgi:hypothetical protein